MQEEVLKKKLRELLNSAFNENIHAQEETLPYVNGYFEGVSDAIIAMGYTCHFDHETCVFSVEKDPYKKAGMLVYARYAARMADGHMQLMLKKKACRDMELAEREGSICRGMNDVLKIFGYELRFSYEPMRYQVVKYENRQS